MESKFKCIAGLFITDTCTGDHKANAILFDATIEINENYFTFDGRIVFYLTTISEAISLTIRYF